MAIFSVGDKVKVKQIDDSTHYDEYVGKTGTIVQIFSQYSSGPDMCPYIAVELGDGFGEVRFFGNELEFVS